MSTLGGIHTSSAPAAEYGIFVGSTQCNKSAHRQRCLVISSLAYDHIPQSPDLPKLAIQTAWITRTYLSGISLCRTPAPVIIPRTKQPWVPSLMGSINMESSYNRSFCIMDDDHHATIDLSTVSVSKGTILVSNQVTVWMDGDGYSTHSIVPFGNIRGRPGFMTDSPTTRPIPSGESCVGQDGILENGRHLPKKLLEELWTWGRIISRLPIARESEALMCARFKSNGDGPQIYLRADL
ncbi:hypothetical protein HYFRA_00009986 [Hymenoscyphus fraxineus]|uniref:Uncharacterized protein n=1 Tax=Hymenoscyphus fraxineus TaxID=746836 RepID=A0A9N9KU57_9HELO|nr:hypothetical protein HYFRA_00009986 [Hymenoscyphus fraxineus]